MGLIGWLFGSSEGADSDDVIAEGHEWTYEGIHEALVEAVGDEHVTDRNSKEVAKTFKSYAKSDKYDIDYDPHCGLVIGFPEDGINSSDLEALRQEALQDNIDAIKKDSGL